MAESQSKRVEEEEKVGKETNCRMKEKISLETGVCVLAFPYVQFSPVTSCSDRQPGLVKELCKNSTEALTASAEPGGCGAG